MSNYPKYCRNKPREELLGMITGAASSAVPVPGAFTVGTTTDKIRLRGLKTLILHQSAQADFVCIAANSIRSSLILK